MDEVLCVCGHVQGAHVGDLGDCALCPCERFEPDYEREDE